MATELTDASGATALPQGFKGLARDWTADRQTFHVPWGKAHDVVLPPQRHVSSSRSS